MKKVLFLFMVSLLTFGLVSCSSDDDDNVNANTIVGHWTGSSYQIYEDENLTNLVEDHSDVHWDFKFFNDGTCSYRGYNRNTSCDYKLLNKELIIYYLGRDYDTYYIMDYSKNSMKLRYQISRDRWLAISLERVD